MLGCWCGVVDWGHGETEPNRGKLSTMWSYAERHWKERPWLFKRLLTFCFLFSFWFPKDWWLIWIRWICLFFFFIFLSEVDLLVRTPWYLKSSDVGSSYSAFVEAMCIGLLLTHLCLNLSVSLIVLVWLLRNNVFDRTLESCWVYSSAPSSVWG